MSVTTASMAMASHARTTTNAPSKETIENALIKEAVPIQKAVLHAAAMKATVAEAIHVQPWPNVELGADVTQMPDAKSNEVGKSAIVTIITIIRTVLDNSHISIHNCMS